MSASLTLLSTPGTLNPAARSDVGRRYVTAAVQTGIGGIISRVLQGFTPIILARYLGPKEYGVYALVLSLVNIVAGVSHLGQNAALQKFLPEYSVRNPARGGAILANTVIVISGSLMVLCTAFFFASNWMASALYHDPSLARVFQFSALLVLTFSLFNLASSVAAGLQDFSTYSGAMMLSSAAFIVFGWLGVWLLGLYGALLGELLAGLVGLILLMARALSLTRQRFPGAFRPQFSGEILKEIFSFAFPALLAGLLVSPAYWWANTLLARHAGFEQVGLFGVAFVLAQLIMLVPMNLSIPAVSFMSEVHARDNTTEFSGLVSTNLRLVWVLSLPMAVGCALFSYPLITLLFGIRYEGATTLVLPLSITALLMVINNVIGSAIAGSGRMWNGFLLNLLWLAMFLPLGMHIIPRWGAAGIAITFVVSYLLFTVVEGFYSKITLHIEYRQVGRLVGVSLAVFCMVAILTVCLRGPIYYVLALVFVTSLLVVEWKHLLSENERSALLRLFPWRDYRIQS